MEQLISGNILGSPILFYVILAWEIGWRGWGLWRSARGEQRYWFIAILLINSLGILPIFYLFVFSDEKKMKKINSYFVKFKKLLGLPF